MFPPHRGNGEGKGGETWAEEGKGSSKGVEPSTRHTDLKDGSTLPGSSGDSVRHTYNRHLRIKELKYPNSPTDSL